MMTEYLVKVGFWLRAYDSVTVEAVTDSEAIEKAKAAAKTAMDSRAYSRGDRHRRAAARSDRLYRQACRRRS